MEAQLETLLSSPAFRGSTRCSQFLRFVCERSLAGEGATLKERTIAIEVFKRSPQADLSEDTIVRVGAREVRKRLAQYYVSEAGSRAPIHIHLPSGSYVPEFRLAPVPQTVEPLPPVNLPAVRPPSPRWWLTAAAVFGIATLSLTMLTRQKGTEPFTSFWQPMFRATRPVVLAVDVRHTHPEPNATKRSVEFGELVASSEVSALFGRHSKELSARSVDSLGVSELEHTNLVLIGYSGLSEMGQLWRFRMEQDIDSTPVLVDSASSTRRFKAEMNPGDGTPVNDYVLISRVRDPETSTWTIASAGLHARGTEYGGRLLRDPARLGSVLRKLPPDWASRNLQVILRERPGNLGDNKPELVAWHLW